MQKTALCLILLISLSAPIVPQQKLSGQYLGQKPPGSTPEILNHGFPMAGGFSFSPDGTELFYHSRGVIMHTELENGQWSKPQTSSFSGQYRDFDFNFSPDGTKLFFTSNRPISNEDAPKNKFHIWFVMRTETGWSEPMRVSLLNNADRIEVYPSVSRSGNLYFFTNTEGGQKPHPDIYWSKLVNGQYAVPEKLGSEINSGSGELDPFIAPDESYLIFHSFRTGGWGAVDLYISFRKNDGTWSEAINMGDTVNTAENEFSGKVTMDGKYFYFERSHPQTRNTFLYWVSAKFIEELRPKEKERSKANNQINPPWAEGKKK